MSVAEKDKSDLLNIVIAIIIIIVPVTILNGQSDCNVDCSAWLRPICQTKSGVALYPYIIVVIIVIIVITTIIIIIVIIIKIAKYFTEGSCKLPLFEVILIDRIIGEGRRQPWVGFKYLRLIFSWSDLIQYLIGSGLSCNTFLFNRSFSFLSTSVYSF